MKFRVARRATRGLYVGRTIADREGADLIDTPHIAEALKYREREGE
jgi:predicted ATPase with chaperone activity